MEMTELYSIDLFEDNLVVITKYIVDTQTRDSFWVHLEEFPEVSYPVAKSDICNGVHTAGYYWSIDQLYAVEIGCACKEIRELQDRIRELSDYVDLLEEHRSD
jgi:hypothetical protein